MKGSNPEERARRGKGFLYRPGGMTVPVADMRGSVLVMREVDWDHLNALRDDIGAEDFADVVLLFFSEIGERLDGMRAGSVPPSAADFHFLRGSAANLGFVHMVGACETAEAACSAGHTPDLQAVLAAFEAALAVVRREVPDLAAA